MKEKDLTIEQAFTLATRYHQKGNFQQAEALYNRILEIHPNHYQSMGHLGLLAKHLKKYDLSEKLLKQAIQTNPIYMEAYHNLGDLFNELGEYQQAIGCYQKAIQINPNYAETHSNLGIVFKELEEYQQAIGCYQKAIQINPNYVQAYYNLGILLNKLGEYERAIDYYHMAIQINPNIAEVYKNLHVLLREKKLNVNDVNRYKYRKLFLFLFKRNDIDHNGIFPAAELTLFSDDTIFEIKSIIDYDTLFLENQKVQSLLDDELALLILQKALISDVILEDLLTQLRKKLLITITDANPTLLQNNIKFIFSLAEQCFLNEYIFFQTEKEVNLINQLQYSLEDDQNINELEIALLGCYVPLSSSKIIADKLFNYRSKNHLFNNLIKTQISEPLKEKELMVSIKPIGNITNSISKKVQGQYEINPYPRWKNTHGSSSNSFLDILNHEIEPNKVKINSRFNNPSVLVAGCGTGKHIFRVQNYYNAKIIGIDLSLSSLSYAKRKTDELGFKNVEYYQADILQLGKLGKKFDVIESVGVLHHMETPLNGLEVLVDLLKPHGFLKLGLYSEVARKNVVEARKFIKKRKFNNTTEGIRRCRKTIFEQKSNQLLYSISLGSDFYSTSSVRDLIFHEQERRFTLPQISEILNKFKLEFLGFQISYSIKKKYSNYFPKDTNNISLENWHQFEKDNPNTFAGMYQFWVKNKNT